MRTKTPFPSITGMPNLDRTVGRERFTETKQRLAPVFAPARADRLLSRPANGLHTAALGLYSIETAS
jgi:hypothetical protein